MLCLQCSGDGAEAVSGRTPRWPDARMKLDLLFCSKCHAVLPIPDGTERLLRALEALAGFGLAGCSGPLLSRAA